MIVSPERVHPTNGRMNVTPPKKPDSKRTTAETAPEIAARVGYESDAAFSRAFKRGLGEPPASWRTKSRGKVPAARVI
jgi:AraC-like DNA-binding protein